MNLAVIFFTGLTTGGLSCLAMQGGLLASMLANQKNKKFTRMALVAFLVSKLLVHTLFGFALGWLGSQVSLSLTVRIFFQFLAALFMLATAFNLLELHPIFRYVVLQPPQQLFRFIKNNAKNQALFAPAFLGALTVFIPCGVTQAMEVLAMTSGSPWYGASIMFFFVLGTMPLFVMVGAMTAKLSENLVKRFTKVAAYLLIAIAALSLNGVLVVLDSPITFGKMVAPVTYFFSSERFSTPETVIQKEGVQQVTIYVGNHGYTPRNVVVQNNIPVELTLKTNETYSCAVAFVFKEFGIETFLEPTDSQTFTFTPTRKGTFAFTCSMGMYSGTLQVK